jgi:hypothetical protein
VLRVSWGIGRAALMATAWALAMRAGVGAATLADSGRAPCSLSVTVSKAEVSVGEPFVVEVRGQGPAGATWTFPREAGSEDVTLKGQETGGGALPAGVMRYAALAFALSQTQVPALVAKCHLSDGSEVEARSEPVAVKMVSLLPKDPKEQRLADIRGPMPLAIGRAFWIAAGLALLLLGAALYLWWWRRRRARHTAEVAAPLTPPDVEARQSLAQLGSAGLLERGDWRGFYIALAQVAKRYLERRLEAPVLEMTSTEAVAFLREHAHARGLAAALRELVGAADQVKFARGSAPVEEARRHLRAVSGMVDALEAALRPPPAEEGRAA